MNSITVRKPKVAAIETTYTTTVRIDGNDHAFVTRHHRRVETPRKSVILETYPRHNSGRNWFHRLFGLFPSNRLTDEEINTAKIAVENKIAELL